MRAHLQRALGLLMRLGGLGGLRIQAQARGLHSVHGRLGQALLLEPRALAQLLGGSPRCQ